MIPKRSLVVCIQARRKQDGIRYGRALNVAYKTGYSCECTSVESRPEGIVNNRSPVIFCGLRLLQCEHYMEHRTKRTRSFRPSSSNANFASRLSGPTTILFYHTSCMPHIGSALLSCRFAANGHHSMLELLVIEHVSLGNQDITIDVITEPLSLETRTTLRNGHASYYFHTVSGRLRSHASSTGTGPNLSSPVQSLSPRPSCG